MEWEGRRIPIEFKLHSAPGNDHLKGMRKVMKDLGLEKGWVVYPGEKTYSLGNGVTVVGLARLLAAPTEVLG